MTLRGVTKCCRRGSRTDMHPRHLVLILVLVLTEPVASLRGPEEDWLDPADHGGGAYGGNNMTTANRTRDSIAGSEQARLQAPLTLKVRLQPQHVTGEGTTQEMKKKSSAGRGFSKRIIRRKAAYPRRHLLDSRRSLMPGPPYDHYRRMVHVPLGTPTTLAPLPPTLHTLPQPPTQPTLSKNSLHSRLYPKKMLPQSTPSIMSIFRKDKVPGPPRFLSPTPLPPPPRLHPRPIPTRPYHHRPNPRPHPPHPLPPPPSYHSSTITPSTPSPVFSFPRPFPTLPPQPPSSSPPVAFTRPPHHTVPFRPPSVFSLGRRSTPRPLQPRPSVPPASPTPPPTRPPSLTTTSLPSPPLSKASRGHKRHEYPVYATVPTTSFTCRATPRPGLYGDVETGCQAWHVCEADGRQHSFLCPNGTVFNQRLLTCDWWYNVRCGSDDLHITTNTKWFSEGHTDPGLLYGKKMTPKLIKPHLPNREAAVTSNVARVLPGPAGATPRQPQQGQSPSPHFRGFYHGGIFPRFRL